MSPHEKLTSKDVGLIICFTALYAVFASIPLFKILGVTSNNITAAAITVPIMGVILGPYLGVLSAVFGGAIGFFYGFFPPSFFSGVVATLCSGLLYKGRRISCVLIYLSLLIVFGFYPFNGPIWLFPLSMWFQIIGLFILISPLSSIAAKNIRSNSNSKVFASFFIVSLISTLAGQISGSLAYLLIVATPKGGWQLLWQGLTFVYPIERTIIALGSALIGAPLLRVLRSSNLTQAVNRANMHRKPS